jgi:hypothetical protein
MVPSIGPEEFGERENLGVGGTVNAIGMRHH